MKAGSLRGSPWLPLGVILLGTILVRFIGLGRESLWNDEAFSGYAAQLPSLKDVIGFISFDVHPPGYFAFLWSWGRVFGVTDAALRASSAVAGVLSVPIAYRIGRQLFDQRTGLFGAFITAFIFQSIYYSQELRAYIFLVFFSGLSVTLLLDCLRDLQESRRQSPLRYVGLLLICGVNGYFHYFGLLFSFLVVTTLVVYGFHFKRQRKIALLFGLGFLAMYAPWIPVALHSVNKSNWITAPTVRFVLEAVNVFYGAGWRLDLIAVIVILVGYGLFFFRQKSAALPAGDRWLLAWIFVPLVISLAVSLTVRPVYSPRNLLLAAIPAWLLLARGFSFLPIKKAYQWPALIGLVAAMHLIQATIGHGYFVRPTKQQLREAAYYVADRNPSRLPIYAIDWDRENFSYYLRFRDQADLVKPISRLDVQKNGLAAEVKEDRVWIVSGGINVADTTDLNKEFKILDQCHYHEADAYLLERRHDLNP